jgi:hypothetical protein
MAGVAVSGVLWAIFQNNAGGAWDNAKKSFEAGVMINGEMTFKGSDAHKAAVTGDTVGDPFKDTSGPSMNILIKLTCLVGLVIAPICSKMHVVTSYLFWEKYGEVQLTFPVPIGYDPSKSPRGFRLTYSVKLAAKHGLFRHQGAVESD